MWLLRSCLIAVASSALLTRVASSQARVLSTISAPPTVAAAAANAISVTVVSGAVQSISRVTDNAPNTFPSPVRITVSWDLPLLTAFVQVLGYFTNPAVAMTAGAVSIPSSWLKGRVMTSGTPGAPTSYTAFTQNGVSGIGTAGGSLSLMRQFVLLNPQSSRTFDLDLQLDLTGRVLTPGSYSGTLNIRAVAQ